jgi:transcriptional regulator with GAF, ATPase, and Fis domain
VRRRQGGDRACNLLPVAAQRGEYRADLYYWSNVVSIFLPPLRERRVDIPPLVAYFVTRFNKEKSRQLKVSPTALKVLATCYWPVNVRDPQNCIECTVTMVLEDTPSATSASAARRTTVSPRRCSGDGP